MRGFAGQHGIGQLLEELVEFENVTHSRVEFFTQLPNTESGSRIDSTEELDKPGRMLGLHMHLGARSPTQQP